MTRLLIILAVLVLLVVLVMPLHSQAYTLQECNAACAQLFPGGPVVPPVTPPVGPPVAPPAGPKVCTMPITFERAADQNDQKAAVLFRTLQDSQVTGVSVNGEVARRGRPYKGCPVFLMEKEGGQYLRPLKFVVQMADSQTCTATSGTSDTGPVAPTTSGYKHKKTYKFYGVRNGGRQAWRTDMKGTEYGPNFKMTFSSGKSFIVRNNLKNCRDRDDTCNRDSRAPGYGWVYKPGIGPNGEGDSDTGTSDGKSYVHAPYGDKSEYVTFEYNGK